MTEGYHNLSHHGKDPGKIAQLTLIEMEQMKAFRDLLAKLHAADDGGGTLLERTTVCSAPTSATPAATATRTCRSSLAGGGFRHGQHLAFNPTKNAPLPNLFVTILQRLGLEIDRFASSTGTLTGFEMT